MAKVRKFLNVTAIAMSLMMSFQAHGQLTPILNGSYWLNFAGSYTGPHPCTADSMMIGDGCLKNMINALDANFNYLQTRDQEVMSAISQEIENSRAELISKMTATLKEQIKSEILEELRREGKLKE